MNPPETSEERTNKKILGREAPIADVNAGNPTGQNARELNSAYRLVEQLIGKTWFEEWSLSDICLMLRNALKHPRCPTCKGVGYQNLIGAPGCMGGCEDCDGTGLALVGKREERLLSRKGPRRYDGSG